MITCSYICSNLKQLLTEKIYIKGKVCGVFDKALNLQTEENILITCLQQGRALVPYGLVLEDFVDISRYKLNDIVTITTSSNYGELDVFVGLDSVRTIHLKLMVSKHHVEVSDIMEIVRLFCETHSPPCSIGEILAKTDLIGITMTNPSTQHGGFISDYLVVAAPLLEAFMLQVMKNENISTASNILGLGIGLTPSSDDFILGLLSTFFYFNDSREKDLKNFIAKNMHTTTIVSYNMLNNCLHDFYPAYVLDFYQNIFNDFKYINDCLKAFLVHGYSSGIDTLYGIYFGLWCLK